MLLRWLALQGRWWRVEVPGPDWPNAGLVISDLTAKGDDLTLSIQRQHVAVPTHQFQDKGALDDFARPRCEPNSTTRSNPAW